ELQGMDVGGAMADKRGAGSGAPRQAVDRAWPNLEYVSEVPHLGSSHICCNLAVHGSTGSLLFATSDARDVVEQVTDRGAYRLGLGLRRMAYPVSTRFDLARDGQAVCDGLADATHETSNAAILDEGYAVTITQSAGRQMVGVAGQYVGQRAPLHATSTGKLLLAHASDQTWEQVASEPLTRFTDATCTDIAQLAEELALIRHRGWSSAVGEWED